MAQFNLRHTACGWHKNCKMRCSRHGSEVRAPPDEFVPPDFRRGNRQADPRGIPAATQTESSRWSHPMADSDTHRSDAALWGESSGGLAVQATTLQAIAG
jgi:hypothetical protein